MMTFSSGDLVADKYRLEAELGRGSAGTVFRAEDVFMHRWVAIKLLQVDPSSTSELSQRMRREVVITGSLSHPNIVTVHDAGLTGRSVDGETMYLVMELVEGRSLRELLEERGKLPAENAVALLLQVLDALACAHHRGIVHRDLKPENIMVQQDGVAKVTDFGLAKLFSDISDDTPPEMRVPLTLEGSAVGTPAYMAPEQFLGRSVDHRVDLFAAGAVLYELLAGKPLAAAVSPLAMASSLQPGRRAPTMPPMPGDPRLAAVLERALAIPRDARFQSCEDFIAALETSRGSKGWGRFFNWFG